MDSPPSPPPSSPILPLASQVVSSSSLFSFLFFLLSLLTSYIPGGIRPWSSSFSSSPFIPFTSSLFLFLFLPLTSQVVLDYLREHSPVVLPPSIPYHRVIRELEFYGIPYRGILNLEPKYTKGNPQSPPSSLLLLLLPTSSVLLSSPPQPPNCSITNSLPSSLFLSCLLSLQPLPPPSSVFYVLLFFAHSESMEAILC
jgi:hypothetical protein